MSLTDFTIVFGGAAVLAVLLLIFGPAVLKFLPTYLKMIFPILGRRATPEQEAEAQRQYRQGGDGNIPLPAQDPKRKKSLFGKTKWPWQRTPQ